MKITVTCLKKQHDNVLLYIKELKSFSALTFRKQPSMGDCCDLLFSLQDFKCKVLQLIALVLKGEEERLEKSRQMELQLPELSYEVVLFFLPFCMGYEI